MRYLIALVVLLAGCGFNGNHYQACYYNHTCDRGLTCVWLAGHGSACIGPGDLKIAKNLEWQDVSLADGGAQ